MIKRIAVTQRVTDNTTYPERRDALAQDWSAWLSSVFPTAAVLAVPNRPDGLDVWIDACDPDAVVMTGGNDWGDAPERDQTERQLVARARAAGLPIFGACRGMQALNIMFGGSVVTDLSTQTNQVHIAQNHVVGLSSGPLEQIAAREELTVNSYHGQGVLKSDVAVQLVVFAQSADGVVEGLHHRTEPIIAVQWHPERQNSSAGFDAALVTALFEDGAFWTGNSV